MSSSKFGTVVFFIPCLIAGVALSGGLGCVEKIDATPGAGGGGEGGSGGGSGGEDGGAGGAGGEEGGAGGTGGSSPCLDASEHDAVFAIELPAICVVEKHTAPFEVGYALVPKWGRHQGPVTVTASASTADEITLTRWAVPNGDGPLGVGETIGPVSLSIPPQGFGPFLSASVVDLPLSNWTIIGWTGDNAVGEIIALDGAAVADRWPNVGYFDGAVLHDADSARLLHTSLTELDDGDDGNGVAGLYAADFCAGPALCATDPTRTIATWGLANGPIAVDTQGNVFAVNTDYLEGDQELRGFHADAMAPGQDGEEGTTLATIDGYGSALAVIDPAGGRDFGIALYQAIIGIEAQPLIAQHYSLTADKVEDEGLPVTAITLVNDDAVTLMNDDAGRVWLGVVTGTKETTFYVLARH